MNNIKHIWSVICEKAIIDDKSNNISLIDSIEAIIIKSLVKGRAEEELRELKKRKSNIVVPMKLTLASLWFHELTKDTIIDLKLKFLDPNGKGIWTKDHRIELKKEKKRTRSMITFNGFEIGTDSGVYYLTVSLKRGKAFEKVAEIPFEVKIVV